MRTSDKEGVFIRITTERTIRELEKRKRLRREIEKLTGSPYNPCPSIYHPNLMTERHNATAYNNNDPSIYE